jgi:hypothetical protein
VGKRFVELLFSDEHDELAGLFIDAFGKFSSLKFDARMNVLLW